MDTLNIGAVARSYGLLRLPKIPETRNRSKIDFQESMDINTSSIPYAHKEKEAARLRRLQEMLDKRTSEANAERSVPRGSTNHPPEGKSGDQEPDSAKRKRKKKLSVHQKIMEEWDDMAAETALFKKFKKGKIAKEEYEKSLFTELSASAILGDDDDSIDGNDSVTDASDTDSPKHKKQKSLPVSANGRVDYRKKSFSRSKGKIKNMKKLSQNR
jgi:hypothetical protein